MESNLVQSNLVQTNLVQNSQVQESGVHKVTDALKQGILGLEHRRQEITVQIRKMRTAMNMLESLEVPVSPRKFESSKLTVSREDVFSALRTMKAPAETFVVWGAVATAKGLTPKEIDGRSVSRHLINGAKNGAVLRLQSGLWMLGKG